MLSIADSFHDPNHTQTILNYPNLVDTFRHFQQRLSTIALELTNNLTLD